MLKCAFRFWLLIIYKFKSAQVTNKEILVANQFETQFLNKKDKHFNFGR